MPNDYVIYPTRICQDCRKCLAWARVCGKRVRYIDPKNLVAIREFYPPNKSKEN